MEVKVLDAIPFSCFKDMPPEQVSQMIRELIAPMSLPTGSRDSFPAAVKWGRYSGKLKFSMNRSWNAILVSRLITSIFSVIFFCLFNIVGIT